MTSNIYFLFFLSSAYHHVPMLPTHPMLSSPCSALPLQPSWTGTLSFVTTGLTHKQNFWLVAMWVAINLGLIERLLSLLQHQFYVNLIVWLCFSLPHCTLFTDNSRAFLSLALLQTVADYRQLSSSSRVQFAADYPNIHLVTSTAVRSLYVLDDVLYKYLQLIFIWYW